jgi:hypothetical protein
MIRRSLLTLTLAIFVLLSKAQDSLPKLPTNYIEKVTSKAGTLEQKLDKKTDKVLDQMMKQEEKMKNKLAKIDSSKAQEVFGDVQQKYRDIKERLTKLPGKQYIPSLDTLSTSLKFLQQNPQLVSQVKDGEKKIKDAMGKVNGLESKFQQAEEIKIFLRERKQFLKERLSQFGFAKQLKKINKQAYYYAEQVKEYKELLKDQKKAERKAIELLSKTKLFQDFMRKNSMLASLFRLPGDPADPLAQANLAGLQTRVQVNNLIQQQIAAGGPNAMQQFQQNIQSAQSQLGQLKNKLTQSGGGSSDDIMPEGFKPNGQKTKSVLERIELGTNVQSQYNVMYEAYSKGSFDKKDYNGIDFNCTTFVKEGLNKALSQSGNNVSGVEHIWTDGSFLLDIPKINALSVTPNFLFRDTKKIVDSNSSTGKVLRQKGSTTESFVNAATFNFVQDKDPNY